MEREIICRDWNNEELRRIRGLEMARTKEITRTKEGWLVPSQTGSQVYLVTRSEQNHPKICNCPDFDIRTQKCKHIHAVECLEYGHLEDEKNVEYIVKKKIYSQSWKAYDKSKTIEKSKFMELLHGICSEIQNPNYGFGRPKIPISDMIFASALKIYSTFSLRRFMTDIKEAKEKEYVEKVPCFASVGHFFQNPELTQILFDLIEKTSKPLKAVEHNFALDSSGFSTCRFDRWFSFKYGKEINSRIWMKAHLMIGTKTNIVTAVKITHAYSNDCKHLSEMLTTTAKSFKIKEVAADKAYLSRSNFNHIADVGGTAYIPFKKNSKGKKKRSKMWRNMYHYFMLHNEDFMKHYHKRSNIETTFHMIKSKFGDSLRSKTRTAQVNEILLKILCHNICVVIQEMNELGIDSTRMLGQGFNDLKNKIKECGEDE